MKNLWNSVIQNLKISSNMTLKQRLSLIGFIILPGALPILIFSLFVRQTIVKLMKAKTSKIFGNWCRVYNKGINLGIEITEEDINKDLYEGK